MRAYLILATLHAVAMTRGGHAAPSDCSSPPVIPQSNFQQWKLEDFDQYEGTNLEVTYKNGNLKVHCVHDTWTVNNETHISAESAPKKGAKVDWRVTLVRQSRTQFAFAHQPTTSEWVTGFIPGKVLVMLKCIRPQLVQAYITFTDKVSDGELQVVERYLNSNFEQLKELKIDFAKCSATA